MPGTLPPFFDPQFFDQTGAKPVIAAGYSLYQYTRATTSNENTYTDEALTIPNAHPIVLNSAGKCEMWLDPAELYTFVLKTPAGVTVDTWDVTPTQIPTGGSFVPIAGATMTGLLTLVGNATSNLNAVPKQQMDAAIASALASITSLTDAATAAAAAATAAAAAIKPTHFTLATATGGAASKDVYLSVGTWQVSLDTEAKLTSTSTSSTQTVTQSATVGGTTVGTSFVLQKAASDTQSTYGRGIAVGSLVVSTAGTFTMSMAVTVVGATATALGSILTVEKT